MILERLFGSSNDNERREQEATDLAASVKTLEEALALQQRVWDELYEAAERGKIDGDAKGTAFFRAIERKDDIDRRVRELQEREARKGALERDAA